VRFSELASKNSPATSVRDDPPDPIHHIKLFKGQTLRFALWELVLNWYKTFPSDHIDHSEINSSTKLTNKTTEYCIILCRGSDPGEQNPWNRILNICTER